MPSDGLYAIAEADIESHGMAEKLGYHVRRTTRRRRPPVQESHSDRVQRSVVRDKNNAAVVIWSMGNESGWGENLEIAGRWVKEYDPSRLLHYENIAPYKKDTTPDFSMLDLYSRMYASTQEVDQFFAEGQAHKLFPGRKMPFIQCEYIHAMGNGPGDAEDYQQQIMKYPGFVGGFVWEWCDHAVYGGTTPDNRLTTATAGLWGVPHDGNFCIRPGLP
ncbi:MAG: glycoside hydrolase family 2 TIM barrel-domain containing protein [Acutalibacter sp.]